MADLTSSRWNLLLVKHLVIDFAPKRTKKVTNAGVHTQSGLVPYKVKVTIMDLYERTFWRGWVET